MARISESFRAQGQGVAHLGETPPQGDTLGTPAPNPRPKDERRAELRVACAIAHDVGAKMSEAELIEYVLEHGLPARGERERMRQRRAGEDVTG